MAASERIRSLPDLVLADINGNIFRTDEITSGPLLITYFHPECDHCRYEIASIFSSDLPDCDLRIILVSYADLSQIKLFMEQFDMRDYPLLNVLHDPDLSFREVFGTDVIPSNFIYNKDLQLIKAFRGETTTETILKYLHSSDK
ncbi:MAG: TlpA family protein disulfide reductase [Marinilabiliales bacterium]|nr:TlpA family protein disulfide reductase [Marinilabiliales bacterium]